MAVAATGLLALAIVASPGTSDAVTITPDPVSFDGLDLTWVLVEITSGIPDAGEQTACEIDVGPCTGSGDITLVFQAVNASAATVSSILLSSPFGLPDAPPALTGMGRIPGDPEPDGLADARPGWGGLVPAPPTIEFPSGLLAGQTSNRFFLSFEPGTRYEAVGAEALGSFGSAPGGFELVPEPGAPLLLLAGALGLGRAVRRAPRGRFS